MLRTPQPSRPRVDRRIPRHLFTALSVILTAGVVAQTFLAGLGVLVDPTYFSWHTTFAHALEVVIVALIITSLFARLGLGTTLLSIGVFVAFGAQYAFIHGFTGPARALHVANAFLLFSLGMHLARRGANAVSRGSATAVDDVSAGRQQGRVTLVLGSAVAVTSAAALLVVGLAVGNGATTAVQAGADQVPAVRLYAANCSGCHGANGEGRVGPALLANERAADLPFVIDRVSRGSGIMPAFAGRLDAAEIEALAQHVGRLATGTH